MTKSLFYKHKIENLIAVEKIVTIHYFEFTRDFDFPGEAHDFWEMVYADKGNVLCSGDGRQINLKPGNIIFHKPNEFHTIRSDGVTAPNVFVMTFVCRSRAMSFFNDRYFALDNKLKSYIAAILKEAQQTFGMPTFDPGMRKLEALESPRLGGQQMIRTYLEQFLISIMRSQSEKADSTESFLPEESLPHHISTLIRSYLAENLYEKLTLGDICKRFNYGKTFLCTQYKKATGGTIMDDYMLMKLQKAKKLMRESCNTLRQISDMLQFDTPGHFTGCFKRKFNMSPTQYLKSIR